MLRSMVVVADRILGPGYDYVDPANAADILKASRQWRVSYKNLDLIHIRDTHRCTARELGAISHQHGFTCIGDNGLRYLDFAIVEIQQRTSSSIAEAPIMA